MKETVRRRESGRRHGSPIVPTGRPATLLVAISSVVGIGVAVLVNSALGLYALPNWLCYGELAMFLRNVFVVVAGGTVALAAPDAIPRATLLYAASYSGTITTLNFTAGSDGTASLKAIASSADCAPNPSWLTLAGPVLYCADEGLKTPNGTMTSLQTSRDGILTKLSSMQTLSGPVSSVVYGSGGRGLAVAAYSGSGLSTFDIANPSAMGLVQTELFELPRPGPDKSRQEVAHPHEVILDPTGRYVLVPDLGADLVRVFRLSADRENLSWTPVAPLVATPGSGPRHAAFVVAGNKTFMYLVGELQNTITGYEVSYLGNDALGFNKVYASGTHGMNQTVPSGAMAAEIQVAPDGQYLIVSSRQEASFTIPNFDVTNSTAIPSDALINFAIDGGTGGLVVKQVFPAGGMVPRHFSINRSGDLLAVGLQGDGRVVLISRDVKTGLLEGFNASVPIDGDVTCVVFDEQEGQC